MAEAQGISVLHVDDDPAFADLTADALSEHEAQITVETAMNASEGRDRLAANSFDCIVSDYEMPGKNGIEFLETIRENYPDLPFILYTGRGSEAVASDAIATGVTDYLQKESGTSQYTILANRIRNAVEKRRQQERAQATHDRLRQIIDMLPQLVFIRDGGGEFLLANEATAEAYGTTVADLEGATDADFANSEEELEQFRADDQAVIESGEPKLISEESLTTADGEIRLFETTKIPYDPIETHGDAVLGVSRDITERKERENILQQYQYVYESALSGIAIVHLNGELTDVNPTFLDMWGYDDEDDVIGRSAMDMWADPKQATSVLETIKEQGSWEGELKAVRADGSTFYARGVNSHLTDSEGNPIGVISSFFDITQRKRREAELEMQSAAMEAAMDGISILTEGGEYIYMNQTHADVFEYGAEELLGSNWRRLYDDDEIARFEQEVFPVLEREGEWRGETVGNRRDGSSVYQEITLSLLDDGKLICTSRDITERKDREQALEQTSTVLRTIVENLPMGVLVEDTGRDVLMVNDRLGETLGIPIDSEELIGRDCAAAAEELKKLFADPEGFTQGITERLERREPVQNEELPLADGRVVERDYVPYTLPGGEAHLWLYRDVTARNQQRQELERSTQFLQDTQEVANVGGWEVDMRTESLQWTDEVYRIHGEPLEYQPTFEDGISFYHPDDRDTLRDAFDGVTANGEPYDLELRIVRKTGEIRWVRARGEPWRQDGNIVGVRGTFQDITERKEREKELEEKNERLDEFAGLISHDLRNPLTVALGRTSYLQQLCDGESAEQLDVIAKSLNRMEEIIDDTLTLARKGKRVGGTVPISLLELCGNCWQGIDTSGATLNFDFEDDIKIKGDGNRLKHVFENLFRNAIEHGHNSVTITVGRSGETGFYVEDDGPGIPEHACDDVFEAGHTSERDGTGLGLAIVKRIAEAHGWEVSLTEGSDRGARFEFENIEFAGTQ